MDNTLMKYLDSKGTPSKLISVGTKRTPATVQKKVVPKTTEASTIFVPKKVVPAPTAGLASSVVVKQAAPAKVVQPAQSTQQVMISKPIQPVVKKQTVAITPVVKGNGMTTSGLSAEEEARLDAFTKNWNAGVSSVPTQPQGLARVAAEDVGEGLFVGNTDDKAIYDAFKAKQKVLADNATAVANSDKNIDKMNADYLAEQQAIRTIATNPRLYGF